MSLLLGFIKNHLLAHLTRNCVCVPSNLTRQSARRRRAADALIDSGNQPRNVELGSSRFWF